MRGKGRGRKRTRKQAEATGFNQMIDIPHVTWTSGRSGLWRNSERATGTRRFVPRSDLHQILEYNNSPRIPPTSKYPVAPLIARGEKGAYLAEIPVQLPMETTAEPTRSSIVFLFQCPRADIIIFRY